MIINVRMSYHWKAKDLWGNLGNKFEKNWGRGGGEFTIIIQILLMWSTALIIFGWGIKKEIIYNQAKKDLDIWYLS